MPGSTLAEIEKITALALNGNTQAQDFLAMGNGSAREGLKLLAEAGDQDAAEKMERVALGKAASMQKYKRKVAMKQSPASASTSSLSKRLSESPVSKPYDAMRQVRKRKRIVQESPSTRSESVPTAAGHNSSHTEEGCRDEDPGLTDGEHPESRSSKRLGK
jgi:hypothetical protein